MAAESSVEDGRRTRWSGQRALRRREFVDAAVRLVESGGSMPSVAAIASSVGVGRPVVYRHFTDKADLQKALAEEAAERAKNVVVPAIRLDADLATAMRSTLSAYVGWVTGHSALFRLLRSHAETGPDSPWSRARAAVAAEVSQLARETHPGTPRRLADPFAAGLVGMAEAAVAQWFDGPRDITVGELVDFLATVLQAAVAAAETSTARRGGDACGAG